MHFILQSTSVYTFASTKILTQCVLAFLYFAREEMRIFYQYGQENNFSAPRYSTLLSLFLWSLLLIPTTIFHMSTLFSFFILCALAVDRDIPWLQSKLKMDLPWCNIMILPKKCQLDILILHVGVNNKYSTLKLQVLVLLGRAGINIG